MICPVCQHKADALRSAVKQGLYLSKRCDNCLLHQTGIAVYARKYNRDRGREDYRKDIIQRFEGTEINPEFVDSYPDQAAKQWGNDVLRDYGIKRKQY